MACITAEPDLEDCRNAGPPHVEEAGVKPGIEFDRYFLGHIERQRCLGKADDLDRIGHEFSAAGRFLNGLDRSGNPYHRFTGDCFHRSKNCF